MWKRLPDIKWPPLRATVKTSEINATDNWGEMWEDGFVGGQK